MEEIKTKCTDGIFRWCRHNKRIKKPVKKHNNVEVVLENFDELFCNLMIQYFGVKRHFLSKEWCHKKIKLISTILENVESYKIDLKLFLVAQFELSRKYPRLLWPTNLASLKAVKRFQNWNTNFTNKKQITETTKENTLEEIIENNHKKYLYYKETLNWSDEIIILQKGNEFNPLYIITNNSLADKFQNTPTVTTKQKQALEEIQDTFNTNPDLALDFWKTVRVIQCQKQQQNLISYSKIK